MALPPHRPYDCAIELIPGSTIPKGRLYSFSGPEREAMQEYIQTPLRAGLSRPSSSPAGAGFFLGVSGSRNVKPDDLSRIYDPEPAAKEPEPILPLNRVVGVVT